ncbi:DoxX protein [Catalinimonas alkaloidigena]|uniref:DoxX protein n=1 Tax=Catalinimonas alkaloidigena TaxID=1075417 RepID=A0A1G9RQT9_9BACT|nr:DoxX family protein [Catalinimonas alkaloidigena]SDM24815.1 DoxX protein [Catalinimonas alkaloidigena]
MDTIVRLNKWANAHTNVGFDFLRIALGGFLFYKGIDFMTQTEQIIRVLDPIDTFGWTMIIVHYIAMVHLFGGLLIAIGLLTRLSILIQLPILIAAVLLNFIGDMNVSNLVQASAALLLSCFFLVYGSGKHSADYMLKMRQ